jgi:hypothetical protein
MLGLKTSIVFKLSISTYVHIYGMVYIFYAVSLYAFISCLKYVDGIFSDYSTV